jgi:hypothetical protein
MSYDESELVIEVLRVFRQTHGDMPFTLKFVTNVTKDCNNCIDGVCDFNQIPPEISIREGLSDSALIETLFHELAHLACGLESEHNTVWEKCKDELSLRFAVPHFE